MWTERVTNQYEGRSVPTNVYAPEGTENRFLPSSSSISVTNSEYDSGFSM